MGQIISRRKKSRRLLIVSAAVTLLWMLVIFLFSAQNADESGSMSGNLLQWLLRTFVPHWETMTAAEHRHITDMLHTVFRKLGHFTEYTVLGFLLTLTVRRLRKTKKLKSRQTLPLGGIWLPALLALLYAASDELHQRFVAGRSCELRDVLIDFSGACLGIALNTLLNRLHRKRKARRRRRQSTPEKTVLMQ